MLYFSQKHHEFAWNGIYTHSEQNPLIKIGIGSIVTVAFFVELFQNTFCTIRN